MLGRRPGCCWRNPRLRRPLCEGSGSDFQVSPTDEFRARNNPHTIANRAAVTDQYDYDKNSLVGPSDELIARGNATNIATKLKALAAP